MRKRFWVAAAGLAAAFLLLEAGLRAGGWAAALWAQRRDQSRVGEAGPYRILCLGESTTSKQYPRLLEAALNRRGRGRRFVVVDAGRPGVNTDFILGELEKDLERYQPNAVVAMMGENDRRVGYYQAAPGGRTWLFRHSRAARLLSLLWMNRRRAPDGRGPRGWPPQKIRRLMADDTARSYLALADYYYSHNWKDLPMAEEYARQALAKAPDDPDALALLARVLLERGGPGSARAAQEPLRRLAALRPGNAEVHLQLSHVLARMRRLREAAAEARQAVDLNPGDVFGWANLSRLEAELGRRESARAAREKASELLAQEDRSRTRGNFLKLKAALDRRGAVLFASQYPTRPLALLQRMLEGIPGVRLIDNEASFLSAVEREGYDAYFIDSFAGDFGHCTPKGNALLAENIASAVLAHLGIGAGPPKV